MSNVTNFGPFRRADSSSARHGARRDSATRRLSLISRDETPRRALLSALGYLFVFAVTAAGMLLFSGCGSREANISALSREHRKGVDQALSDGVTLRKPFDGQGDHYYVCPWPRTVKVSIEHESVVVRCDGYSLWAKKP